MKGGIEMSIIPFVFWGGTLVAGTIIYIAVASVIEKAGLERQGATGHLFTCEPKKENK